MAGSEALRLASVRDLPLVATFHSQYYDDFYKVTGSRQLAKLGSKFVVDFYSRCDEVWAVGDKTAEVLHRYGYKGEVIVMPNGTFIRPVREEDKLRAAQAYDLRDDIPVLLFVGQMNWKKNILRILEACALLRKEAFAFKLVLAGQGPDNAKIKEKIHQFDLDSHVCLTGHITDIHLLDGLYQCADLFVFPSLYDAAPMVVREAAAMGTPAVMVEGSCAAEVIQDRDNGFLCKDDPESLRNVIKEALSDQDALKRVAERSRKTIPILWDEIIKCAALRYEALIERNRQGLCKKKNLRII